jgi:hypothetical protein
VGGLQVGDAEYRSEVFQQKELSGNTQTNHGAMRFDSGDVNVYIFRVRMITKAQQCRENGVHRLQSMLSRDAQGSEDSVQHVLRHSDGAL